MSGRRRARSGVVARVAGDVTARLREIRALWLAVNNDPNHSVADLAPEFYYAVGEVLEGRSIDTLALRKIDRERVKQHAEE